MTKMTKAQRAEFNRTEALNAFGGECARFDNLLARLAEHRANHFGANPDRMHWGNVRSLENVNAKIEEILAFLDE